MTILNSKVTILLYDYYKKILYVSNVYFQSSLGFSQQFISQKIPFAYLACWWPILTGAFHLCHLDVPLPGGTGVGGADDRVDRVARWAGIQVHVLPSQRSTEKRWIVS